MKELKPFKLGATYQLRPGCESKIGITVRMLKSGISLEDIKEFTVGERGFNIVEGYPLAPSRGIALKGICLVAPHERRYYRRIDNKSSTRTTRDNIAPEAAKALESGAAIVEIRPAASAEARLALFVNGDLVYCPSDEGKGDTYTACAKELIRYMNSY